MVIKKFRILVLMSLVSIVLVQMALPGISEISPNAAGGRQGFISAQAGLNLSANPASVQVGIPTSVIFTVTSAGAPVGNASITLSGVAAGNGTTNAGGIAVITVNATAQGTITATAIMGLLNGSTTLTAVLPALSLVADRTILQATVPTGVTFIASAGGARVSGATINLNGVATGNGTTDASGSAVISVNATGQGTITATASKPGFTNGSTTLTAILAFLGISASPNNVTVAIPTNVSFSVTVGGAPVSNASIILSGVAAGNSTTDAGGNAVINVNATGQGTITATASKPGFTDGSTTIAATIPQDTVPPANVTNLTLAGNGTDWISISWTNPASDFHHVMIFTNETFKVNTTSNSFNITGLNSGTTYSITVKAVDAAGNVNQSGTSLTAATLPNTRPDQLTVVFPNFGNSKVTFAGVTAQGNTVAAVNTSPPALPQGFTAVGSFLDISTTAVVTPPITVSLKYNTPLPAGYTDSDVRLLHWNDSTAQWINVTTSFDPVGKMVTGVVSSLSPFVAALTPKPIVTKISPAGDAVQTVGSESQTFRISVSQNASITWFFGGSPVNNSTVLANVPIEFTHTPSSTGNFTFSVTATNPNGSSSVSWNWTVRSKTFLTGNRVWDANKGLSLTYTWTPMSFYAFYYDVDSNVGNESLTISLSNPADRNIEAGTLKYSTTPENVSFNYEPWGSYNVIGFMAEKYFAGYTSASTGITSTPISVINRRQLHKILIDDDSQRTVYAGSTLTLDEGYVIKVKDVDITGGKIVLLSLLKDGNEVDTTAVPQGTTYKYSKRIGTVSDIPIIAARVETVFAGREATAAFIKGLFQISESYISVTNGNRYGIMSITDVSDTGISMENRDTLSLSPGTVNDVMGEIKILVADNTSVLRFAPMVKKTGTYEVRGTIATDSDKSFDWNPQNFEGFYYDINEDVGSEKLNLTRNDRTVGENNLVYTTTPQQVSFAQESFGSYSVIGFMAEKYFAGYTSASTGITSTPISTMGSKQLHKVLVDDDAQRVIYAGSTLTLNDGYVIKIKDVSIGAGSASVWLSLLKDGNEIFDDVKGEGEVFVYAPSKVGVVNNLPIIALRIQNVFRGREATAAFTKGVFQISETYTTVNTGNRFGIMEVSAIDNAKIEMTNPSSLTLSSGSTIDVMGKIKFRVADDDNAIRFYPFIIINGSTLAANQLEIDAPANPMVRDTITISVTAGGSPVSGAELSFDGNSIGTTNSTGKLDYLLTRSGVHNITATKLGYERAVKTIQVAEYVDNRLVIEVPAVIDQGFQVSIKVLANGTAVPGANVTFDNSFIGNTDAGGILNYTFNVSGTHNLGASKPRYISVVREISIRMPFSEFKALDINITPGTVFTDKDAVIKSNITNTGTKADTRAVELVINNTVKDNRSVTLAPGEVKEINFTRREPLPGNYTVEIIGQKGLLQVKEEPLNLLLVGMVVTILGAVVIYLSTTAKGRNAIELLGQKFKALIKSARRS